MKERTHYWIIRVLVTIVGLTLISGMCFAQDKIDAYINAQCSRSVLNWKAGEINNKLLPVNSPNMSVEERQTLKAQSKAFTDQMYQIKIPSINLMDYGKPPKFRNKSDCEKYKTNLRLSKSPLYEKIRELQISINRQTLEKNYSEGASIECEIWKLNTEIGIIDSKLSIYNCNCDKMEYNPNVKPDNNSNLEAEFLAEIAKINAGISKINRLANERQLIASLKEAQILCDKIRLLQGRQYFSSTLKKIRKTNPGFSFSINALAEQLTPRYWQEMRNRANQAYHNALQAHSGCVYNEGIQTATYIEVPFRFFKATYDLVTNAQSMFSGSLWGSINAIKNSYGYQDNIAQLASAAGKEVLAAGEDAKDWKSYVGVATGLLSAYNGYKTAFEMAKENYLQADLIVANRETIAHLIKNSKNLLQQFDYYRAYLDAHLSAVDCLNDKLMRLNLDNKSIKGDKITIWGTGLYDWDGDEYLSQIKEAGEDLKNEYIYCEDFIKSLQIAIYHAQENYNTIEEKVKNSGADQTQINDQLSQNRTNHDWFEKESTRLSELYAAFCENEDNTIPDDVEVVSISIIPGVEEQNGDPDAPPVWEHSDDEVYNPANEPEYNKPEQSNSNSTTGHSSTSLIISKGNGWSAQKIENNPASIKNEMNQAIKSGKTPAGIYISDGSEIVVYYIEGNPLGMTSWNLDNYTDGNTLQNGITNKMQEGYFPMGISFTEQGNLYVLYIKSEVKASAWQLVESKPDLNTVSSNMQKWLNQSYVPVGITIFNEMYYTLMVQLTDVELKNWVIDGYEDNVSVINQNVNTKTASGLLPFGFLKQRDIVNILYVGF